MNTKEYRIENQDEYDQLMLELEEQGCKWKFGQRPTEVNLYEPVEGKVYYITLEDGVLNFKYQESKQKKQKSIPKTSTLNLDDDLKVIKNLLNEEEFKGYIKGCLISAIGTDEEYKSKLIEILEVLK